MFGIELTKRNTKTAPQAIEPGDAVEVAGKVGIYTHATVSPYWHEERAGVIRHYVVFLHEPFTNKRGELDFMSSADYVLWDEMDLIKKGTAATAAFATETAA